MPPRKVNPDRFPIVTVPKDKMTIADMQSSLEIVIPHQRGFYSLARTEPTIGVKKDILVQRHSDDALFYGTEARELVGMSTTSNITKAHPTDYDGYTIFVQSTSHNRKLQKGWKLAYENLTASPMYLEEENDEDDGGDDEDDDAEEAEEETKKPKATRAKRKAAVSKDKEEDEKPVGRRTSTRTKRTKETAEAKQAPTAPKRASARSRKAKSKDDEEEEEEEEEEQVELEEKVTTSRRGKRTRKTTVKPKQEEANDDDEKMDEVEEPEEDDEEEDTKPPAKKKQKAVSTASKKKATKKKKVSAVSQGDLEWITDAETSLYPVGYAGTYEDAGDDIAPNVLSEGVLAASRNEAFRSVLMGASARGDNNEAASAVALWKALMSEENHKKMVHPLRAWSIDCTWTPLDKAIEYDCLPLVKMILESSQTIHRHVHPPVATSLKVDSGSLSHHTFGHRTGKVGVSRGGKQGNNALLVEPDSSAINNSNGLLRQVATSMNSRKMVDYLRVLDKQVVHGWGETGFYKLVESGNCEAAGRVAEILLEQDGFGINHVHVSALTIKSAKGKFQRFTKPQVCKKASMNEAVTPVHCAAMNFHTTKPLEELLDANPSAANKVTDKLGRTPMHFAAASQSPAAIKVLTKRGFDIAALDRKGISPLALAARFGRHENIPLLVPKKTKKGESLEDFLNNAPRYWKPPLMEAATKGHAKAVEELLKLGAGVDIPDKQDKKQAIHVAASQGHLNVVRVLLENGASVSALDKLKRTPLIFAAANGHANVVDLLLEEGENEPNLVNASDSSQNSVLHYAAAYGWLVVCRKLLKAGANANADNDWRIKPHVIAMLKGHSAISRLLMEQPSVSVDDRDNSGRTLLSLALESRDGTTMNQVRFLVEDKEADVNIADLAGATPLHYLASGKSHSDDGEILKILLKAGADLTARTTEEKTTPLMLALSQKNLDVIKAMVKAQSELNMSVGGVDQDGQNVFHKVALLISLTPEIVPLTEQMCTLPGATALQNEYDTNGLIPLHLLLKEALTNVDGECFNPRQGGKHEPVTKKHLSEVVKSMIGLGGQDVVTAAVKPWDKKWEDQAKQNKYISLSWSERHTKTAEDMEVKQPYLGWTLLQMSTSLLLPTLVEQCIEAGAEVDGTGDDGLTSLQLAFSSVGKESSKQQSKANSQKYPHYNGMPVPMLPNPVPGFPPMSTVPPYLLTMMDAPADAKAEMRELEEMDRRENAERIIKALVKAGGDVNASDKQGLTCLSYALMNYVKDKNHNSSMLKLMLDQDADVSISESKNETTPLHFFLLKSPKLPIESGQTVLKLILKAKGCDLYQGDKDGNTAIHYAVKACNTEAAMAFEALSIVLNHADSSEAINARNGFGQTPLMFGLDGGSNKEKKDPIELVSEVCAVGGLEVDAVDKCGRTALHYSAIFGASTSAIYLLQCNANLEATDRWGNTPLALAVRSNCEGLALMFFNKGASSGGNITWPVDKSGNDLPLMAKSSEQQGATNNSSLDGTTDTEMQSSTKSVSIFYQVVVNKWKGLAYLMVYENVALTTAVKECYITKEDSMVVRILSKVDNTRLETLENQTGRNLIHVLANLPHYLTNRTLGDVTKILAGTSVNPNLRDTTEEGSLALHLAAASGNHGVIDFLLGHETKPDLDALTEKSKESALYIAARSGNSAIVVKLLDSDADPDLTPPDGDSIVLAAVRASQHDVTKKLLEHPKCVSRMDINRLGPDGKNCLHVAVTKNDIETCTLLLAQKSIDVNAKDSDGNTVIHHVVYPLPDLGSYENVALLKILLDAGADMKVTNAKGKPPLHYAYQQVSGTMVNALLRFGKMKDNKALKQKAKKDVVVPMEQDPLVDLTINFSTDAETLKEKLEEEANARETKEKVPEVDPVSKLGQSCEVVKGTHGFYDITMHETKAQYGMYGRAMFYKMQLLRDKTKNLYILWTRYGRTGETGANQRTPFDDLKKGAKEFEKVFRSKTGGNLWSNRESFERKKHKFVPLDIIEADEERRLKVKSIDQLIKDRRAAMDESETTECKLPISVSRFLRAITDVKAMRERMKSGSLRIDSDVMPLGQLSRASLEQGHNILNHEILPLIQQQESMMSSSQPNPEEIQVLNKKLQELSNAYYDLIPHSWGWNPVVILDNKDAFNAEIALLENLIDVELAVRILAGAQLRMKEIHPAEYTYAALDVGLHPMDKSHPHFGAIEQYVKNSGDGYQMNHVETILFVNRKGEAEKFQDDLFPRKLLWHGSNLANVMGILKEGLRIAPPTADHSGSMFGRGIYFADMLKKSAMYTSPYLLQDADGENGSKRKNGTQQQQVSYLFLCDVALGQSSEELRPTYMETAKDGTESTMGVGWRGPDESGDVVTLDGSTIPLGRVKARETDKIDPKNNPTLQHNEFIVYSVDQVRIRYIVELRNAKSGNK